MIFGVVFGSIGVLLVAIVLVALLVLYRLRNRCSHGHRNRGRWCPPKIAKLAANNLSPSAVSSGNQSSAKSPNQSPTQSLNQSPTPLLRSLSIPAPKPLITLKIRSNTLPARFITPYLTEGDSLDETEHEVLLEDDGSS